MIFKFRKNQLDVRQCGRSMVEMLGVLAIIGVLSVGAIAGYSKAMHKYKMNKATSEAVFLIRSLLNNKDAIKNVTGSGKVATRSLMVSYLKAVDAIPSGWSIKNNMLYDNIGGYYDIFIFDGTESYNNGNSTLVLDYRYDHTSEDICLNWFTEIVRPFDNTYFIWTDNKGIVYYGQEYCNGKSKKCLADASLSDLQEICSDCNKTSSCYLAARLI